MLIKELGPREEEEEVFEEVLCKSDGLIIVKWDPKRVLVGAGARALFYPTLLYNVVRNKIQQEFRWWDWVDEFVLLGAVPFPSDIYRLKELGVCGVVTLNESYETLVPSSLYEDHGIHHLVLPTRDYLFAPSIGDICKAVDFIHDNASHGQSTYVHCKAGRGRSTTVVICYLVKHRQMDPTAAYDYVKSIRPRVLLASAQWKAVQEFYHVKVKRANQSSDVFTRIPRFLATRDVFAFDDGSVVVITEADLNGYESSGSAIAKNGLWTDVNLVYQVKFVREAALAKLSCMWLRCHRVQKAMSGRVASGPSLGDVTLGIHIFS